MLMAVGTTPCMKHTPIRACIAQEPTSVRSLRCTSKYFIQENSKTWNISSLGFGRLLELKKKLQRNFVKIKRIPRTIGVLSVHFLPQLTADLHWMEQSSFFLITLHPINLNASSRSEDISNLSLARPAKKWDGASSGLISGRHLTDLADCNGIQHKDLLIITRHSQVWWNGLRSVSIIFCT